MDIMRCCCRVVACVCVSLSCCALVLGSLSADPARCFFAAGPALHADSVTLPVRYLYVQAVDSTGRHMTSSPARAFDAIISGTTHSGMACSSAVEVLDLHDGRSLVRFRPRASCHHVRLHVTYDGHHIAGSPLTFNSTVQPEHCHCPSGDLSQWLDQLQCPRYPEIVSSMSQYRGINFDEVLNWTTTEFNRPYAQAYCNYAIKDNSVYRKCYGKYQGFSMFVDAVLLSLTRKTRLPDVEFLFNLGDWPLIDKRRGLHVPMFSWCGSDDADDIVWPTYDLTGSTLDSMQRVTLDMQSALSRGWRPWQDRNSTAFWRGRDSRRERLDLVVLSRERPELIDAAITHFFFFKDEQHVYGPTQPRVSFFDFFKYKYQISLDGTVAAYRLPYLLAGGSLVFKQRSKYYEHFYHRLIPGRHYVEIEADLSDLIDKLNWARKNDRQAQRIADQGRQFAQDHLMPLHVMCYHAFLLHEWSKLLTHRIRVRDGMESVVAPEHNDVWHGQCVCEGTRVRDEL